MEDSSKIFKSLAVNKCLIEINFKLTEKKRLARRRWAILAKALKSPTGSEPSSPTDEISVRRISSFLLIKPELLNTSPLITNDQNLVDRIHKHTWYNYATNVENKEYSVIVGHRNRTFSAEDLMGFNNTGNICIWPSEETLSFYVLHHLQVFKDKCVLELGGGMSCLAGMFVAKYALPKSVMLTDGNKTSIESVGMNLLLNKFDCPTCCKVLKWDANIDERYEVIICADCLFFDDARNDLIDCLYRCLHPEGVAMIMAPERGTTLQKFVTQSEDKGFSCKKIVDYNYVVTKRRMDLLNNIDYDDNIHYPILIEVRRA